MLELALGVLVLMAMLTGVLSFGPMFYNAIELESGARAGAMYGAHSLAHAADLAGMEEVARANMVNLSNASVTATRTCSCPDSQLAQDCDAISCNNGAPAVRVTVTTSLPYTPILSYPGLPSSMTLTRVSTMRAQ